MRLQVCSALLCLLTASGAVAEEAAILVATRLVAAAPYDVTLPEKVGLLEAGKDRDLAFQASGRIVRLVHEGASVAAGDVVAALDTELETARLRQAELRLVDAQRELARMQGLRDADAASRKLLESADIAVQLRVAERDAFREELARRTLLAPFAGVVTETHMDTGEIAAPGETIALFMDLAEMRLEIGVPGREISRVAVDARAVVAVPALVDVPVAGTVTRVAQAAGNGRHLFEVEIRIPNPEGRLRPGLGARVRVVTDSLPQAVVVPLDAVVERAGQRVVFFAEAGRARAVSVENAIAQGDHLVLRDPRAAGELVVRGQRDLADGRSVRVDNKVLAGAQTIGAAEPVFHTLSTESRAEP